MAVTMILSPKGSVRLVRSIALVVSFSLASLVSLVSLVAKAEPVAPSACFVAYEEAQVARRARRLKDARAASQRCSAATCPGAVRADCIEWTDQVSRSLPSVVLSVHAGLRDLTEVRVLVDGTLALMRLTGSALELDPGQHDLRFESEGWPPIEKTVLVNEGVKNRPIDVAFTVSATTREPARPGPGRVDLLLGGTSAASFAVAVGFGSWALIQRAELTQRCAPFCAPSDADAVHTKLMVADVALGVMLTTLTVAAVRWALRARGPSTGASF